VILDGFDCISLHQNWLIRFQNILLTSLLTINGCYEHIERRTKGQCTPELIFSNEKVKKISGKAVYPPHPTPLTLQLQLHR